MPDQETPPERIAYRTPDKFVLAALTHLVSRITETHARLVYPDEPYACANTPVHGERSLHDWENGIVKTGEGGDEAACAIWREWRGRVVENRSHNVGRLLDLLWAVREFTRRADENGARIVRGWLRDEWSVDTMPAEGDEIASAENVCATGFRRGVLEPTAPAW